MEDAKEVGIESPAARIDLAELRQNRGANRDTRTVDEVPKRSSFEYAHTEEQTGMSSKGQGSAGVVITTTAVIVLALTSIGYYQYVYVPSLPTSSSATSPTIVGKIVQINMTVGAAVKTTDAYAPDIVRVVIGVNNTIVVHNGDVQNGVGVPHSYTDRAGAFDTGVLQGGDSSSAIQIGKPGTYDVFCVVHPTTMRATVIVVAGPTGGITSHLGPGSNTTSAASATSTAISSSLFSGPSTPVSVSSGARVTRASPGFTPNSLTVESDFLERWMK
jgi:plastocyanin